MSFISTYRINQVRNDLELLLILAKRDISVRYKQTFLGIIWAIIKPLDKKITFWKISRNGLILRKQIKIYIIL